VSANKYKPHLIVVPEDEADRQMAFGFVFHPAVLPASVDVRPPAGGWAAVLDLYERQFVPHLRKFPAARVVLLLDFDDRGDERGRSARTASRTISSHARSFWEPEARRNS
jgi:hypothetical protein